MGGAADAGIGLFDRLLALLLLAAGLSLLATALRPPAVALRWESGSEQDVAAYNLYRERLGPGAGSDEDPGEGASGAQGDGAGEDARAASDEEPDDGAVAVALHIALGKPINEAPIPAKGHASQGARYAFRDAAVARGDRYRYRIEELNDQGQGRLLPDAIEVTVADHRAWQWALGLAALAVGAWGWWGSSRRKTVAPASD